MAVNPKILYNFNEGSATAIRDYSENGEDATGAGLTNGASSRVGNEVVFDGVASKLERSAISYLSNVDGLTIWLGIDFGSATGTDYIFNINGIVDCRWDGTTLTARLTTTTATYTVTNDLTALSTGVYYDIVLRLNSSNQNWGMNIDGTTQTTAATVGNTPVLSPDLDIGWDGSGNYGKFALNEFKLYNETVADTILLALQNEVNGVRILSGTEHGYAVGDVIGSNINTSIVQYAIVTFIESTTIYRMQPITDNVAIGSLFTRVGHLFDTTRQWMFIMDDTPQICFYDGISLSSEVLSASKKVYCMNRDGVIPNSSTKTANYTVLSTDQRIYVDSSGGVFTITLESSPATDRQLEIIDSVGGCGSNTVTADGNGNNIIGNATALMNADYIAYKLIFNGTQWNLN